MSHVVIVRAFKPGDETGCKELIRDSVMSSLGATFCGMLFKEITFQLIILLSAIMFIFFGMPLTVCLSIVPVVVVLMYAGTYVSFATKLTEINAEVNNIPRLYMSNAFSCFWVAEAFEPHLMTRHPKEVRYTIMTEEQFRQANVSISMQAKKIVGTVGLCKSHRLDRSAWIKRLCVHEQYQRKGVASYLLNVAVQFAIDAGYSCANVVSSEYTEGGRELCLKKGFELKQMYHKSILGSYITVLMYELTYRIKPTEDDYSPRMDFEKEFLSYQF
ncbi:PREDICTED: probable N-acetyltransferase CML3 [Wasmannia auropunctata]|uniref:probable N-acetyltransferase CML3 n=1 Tax=Wasmannia auropunctata TaxID=64793 RepID=UPI0005F02249|nr:PREDICTED: probable N-acetyltransferase CML3 [Wasmannia auropunctata]XP_011684972.1 PREDICTED: probable N-acetyltransferase CML3 [Wasmannia auropunctata]XP_011684973.1 PREDICTED: probable N-acetyltransferase CML3 [Wasmannia auropunctata]